MMRPLVSVPSVCKCSVSLSVLICADYHLFKCSVGMFVPVPGVCRDYMLSLTTDEPGDMKL